MSLGVGVVSSSKHMGFDGKKNGGEGSKGGSPVGDKAPEIEQELGEKITRQMSECSIYTTDNEEEEDYDGKIQLGPKVTLKEQYEKDKDDESLRKWKEQLLGTVDMNAVGESLDPEVKILNLAIKSPGRPDIILPIPESGNPKGAWFTLKEGSKYSLKFTFQVMNNIVSGLKYTNTVWKTGIKVDSAKEMIGTFSPQTEPYTHEMPEDTAPSGMFVRGSYSARTKVKSNYVSFLLTVGYAVITSLSLHLLPCLLQLVNYDPCCGPFWLFQFLDDDNKCYLDINYTFEIKKEWQSS